MGKLQATELVKLLQQEQAIIWHQYNPHYPPIDLQFVAIAKEAIDLANEGKWDTEVTVPNGVVKSVAGIVEELHLDSFLDEEVE